MRCLTVERLRGGLVVSCQADAGSPLNQPEILAALAVEAVRGGAVGIRANGQANVAAIAGATPVPVIAINKVQRPGSDVIITPTFDDAIRLFESASPWIVDLDPSRWERSTAISFVRAGGGASSPTILALDATNRPRPDGSDWREIVTRMRNRMDVAIMADVSSFDEGIAADAFGVELIATTLSGCTKETAGRMMPGEPDLDLVRRLAAAVKTPVVCEGRVSTPEQAQAALDAGAFAVVVGSAITDPAAITGRFVVAIRGVQK